MTPFKIKHSRKIVSLFIAAALGLFIFLAAIIAYNNNLFRPRIYFYTLVQNAYGLNSLPPIYFKGFAIGQVKRFELTSQNKIRVDFYIFEDLYDKVLVNSVVSINSNPISGEITEFQLIGPKGNLQELGRMPQEALIPDLKSKEGQALRLSGKLDYEAAGIEGILDKTNQMLQVFIEQKSSEKIDGIIANAASMMATIEKTVKSYGAEGKGEGHRQVINLLDKVNQTMNSVLDTATYIKETIEVIHRNRQDLPPLIFNTNKTLEKAQRTLEGINNNPFLKGGINQEKKVQGLEMVQ